MEKNSPTLGTSSSYVTSTLSEDFQVICCKLHAQHPSWQFKCKYQQVNKVKGQLGFPQKTKSPSGATTGGIPHPEKMVPFFRKYSQVRQLRLNLSLGQTQIEHGQPSGQDARVRDSLRLQQDTALLPRLRTSGPLAKSKLSTSDLPKSRKRAAKRRNRRNKKLYLYLQKCLN
jgi:hypothetical protein